MHKGNLTLELENPLYLRITPIRCLLTALLLIKRMTIRITKDTNKASL